MNKKEQKFTPDQLKDMREVIGKTEKELDKSSGVGIDTLQEMVSKMRDNYAFMQERLVERYSDLDPIPRNLKNK